MEARRRGRRKKRLKAKAVPQLYLIFEEQPVKEPLEYELQLWLLCRKYGDGMTGRASLPFSGTILEQDAELMLAFTVFEEVAEEWKTVLAEREKQQKRLEAEAESYFGAPVPH